jgi:hypothetical protein
VGVRVIRPAFAGLLLMSAGRVRASLTLTATLNSASPCSAEIRLRVEAEDLQSAHAGQTLAAYVTLAALGEEGIP